MTGPSRLSALEILKGLPRTNCGECGLPTCLAFANQIALGQRAPSECPHLAEDALARLEALAQEDAEAPEADQQEVLDELGRRVREIAFSSVADRLDAQLVEGGDLAFRCLGKEFRVDQRGRLRSPCHANFWVLVPLLDTIVRAADRGAVGADPTGRWVKLDELPEIMSSSDFFSQSTEGALRTLAERDLALLTDLLEVFGGAPRDHGFGADLSVVVRPLPRLPLLLCYWGPAPPFESKLGIYFDETANEHLSAEGIQVLLTGLVMMLKRVFTRHSFEAIAGK